MPGILIKTRFSSTTPTSQPTKKKDGMASHSSALTQLNGKCCRARLPKRPLVRLSSSSSIQSALLIVLSLTHSWSLSPPCNTWKLLRLSCATCPTMAESFCCSFVVLQPKGYKSSTMHMLPEHPPASSALHLCRAQLWPGLACFLSGCSVSGNEKSNRTTHNGKSRQQDEANAWNEMEWAVKRNEMKWNGTWAQ